MDPAKKGQPLDEDDNFEEFPQDDWTGSQMDPKDPKLWDASWDDDQLDDYVGQQIRTITPKVIADMQAKASQGQQQAQQQQQQQQQQGQQQQQWSGQ